mgnify:CR=1 FL=1
MVAADSETCAAASGEATVVPAGGELCRLLSCARQLAGISG